MKPPPYSIFARDQVIDAIMALAQMAEKFDQLYASVGPICPSGMTPVYLKKTS